MTDWVNVRSKAIRRIGYDVVSKSMYIDFEDSDPVYTFCHVPEQILKDRRGRTRLIPTSRREIQTPLPRNSIYPHNYFSGIG